MNLSPASPAKAREARTRSGAGCNKPAGSARRKPSRWCKTTRTERDLRLDAASRRQSPQGWRREWTHRESPDGEVERIPREEVGLHRPGLCDQANVSCRIFGFDWRRRSGEFVERRARRATLKGGEDPRVGHSSDRRPRQRERPRRSPGDGQDQGGGGKPTRRYARTATDERFLAKETAAGDPEDPTNPMRAVQVERRGSREVLKTLKGR